MILSFHFLLQLRFVRHTGPAFLNFGLRDLRFHRRRRRQFGRRLLDPRRGGNNQCASLHFGDGTGFHRGIRIDVLLAFEFQTLNGATRLRAERVVIGTVIINNVVGGGDVGHVHRLVDVSNVLGRREDAITQDRLADVTNIDKVVVGRPDIVFDIYAEADIANRERDSRPARRQRGPADNAAAMTP